MDSDDGRLFAYSKDPTGRLTSSTLLQGLSGDKRGTELIDHQGPALQACSDFVARRIAGCLSAHEGRAVGCMLGLVVGDALGAPLEGLPARKDGSPASLGPDGSMLDGAERGRRADLKPGQWTDDGSLALCLADSLLATGFDLDALDFLLRSVAWWRCGYNNPFRLDAERRAEPSRGCSFGIGHTTRVALHAFEKDGWPFTRTGEAQSSGNGTIMRLAPAAVCFHQDDGAAMAAARAQSLTTHRGEEAAECAALLALTVARLIRCEYPSPEERKAKVFADVAHDFTSSAPSVAALARSDADWRWATPAYEHPTRGKPGSEGGFAMDALRAALHCLYATNSFAAAVVKAVNLRGDADTVAAITGQLAGALYGVEAIPAQWVADVERWDGGGRTALRAHWLFSRVPPQAAGAADAQQ